MEPSRLSFALLLPLVDLAIWANVIAIPAALDYNHLLRANSVSGGQRIRIGQIEFPRNRLLPIVLERTAFQNDHLMTDLNFPGEIVEILISLPTSERLKWHPATFPMQSWRPIAFPFFALPAWWLVGCGVDSFIAKLPISRRVRVVGWILFIVFALSFGGSLIGHFMSSLSDRADMDWVLPGLALWAGAFAVFPLGRLKTRW